MKIENIHFVINHVFLPPQLPQRSDGDVGEKNVELLDFVRDALELFRTSDSPSTRWNLSTFAHTFAVVRASNSRADEGNNFMRTMRESMENMFLGNQDTIALHIGAQNTGLIIRRVAPTKTSGPQIIFEAFEASPTSAAVLGAKGKLRCSYPGPAIAVDMEKIKDHRFLDEFIPFLDRLHVELIKDAIPESVKAGSTVQETRETINPRLFVELLTGLLRGIGSPANVHRIQKRIADDVLRKNSRLPWRRSPLWLVIRVTLQTTLHRVSAGQHGRVNQYKCFMIFLLARLIAYCVRNPIPSDVLFVMNAKLARRVHKAGELPRFVSEIATQACNNARDVLEKRWSNIQRNRLNPEVEALHRNYHVFQEASRLSLQNCGKRLNQISDEQAERSYTVCRLARHYYPRIYEPTLDGYSDGNSCIPCIGVFDPSIRKSEREIILADFEAWTRERLDDWVEAKISGSSYWSLGDLSEQISQYTSLAVPGYRSHPESISNAILTILELWVALDRLTIAQCPLLADYHVPGFSSDLLDPLLLPSWRHRERASRVRGYLRYRRGNAGFQDNSPLAPAANSDAFSVRYVESSPSHQQLHERILQDAVSSREHKKAEFEQKREEYERILDQARLIECSVSLNEKGQLRHKVNKCPRCKIERRAQQVSLNVHEWPLPDDDFSAKEVVFELSPPEFFTTWREATYKVLVDVLTPQQAIDAPPGRSCGEVGQYPGLAKFCSIRGVRRLVLATATTSFGSSHYASVKFPTTVDKVCVAHSAKWRSYDSVRGQWTKDTTGRPDISDACTFKIPPGPYRNLQHTLDSTGHTSNQVISQQADCPGELSIHEYISFGTLRAGHRLQWLNIARELRARILSLRQDSVHFLILQAAWQAGPAPELSIYGESHEDLASPSFRAYLLAELDRTWATIEENWLESVTAKTLLDVAACILPMCEEELRMTHLRRARSVTLGWTRELYQKLQACPDDQHLRLRVVETAAICRQTFGVDDDLITHWGTAGVCPDEDVAVLVECSIIIQESAPTDSSNPSEVLQGLLYRDQRLSHRLEPVLRQSIIESKCGIDEAVLRIWPLYKPGTRWWCCEHPEERWVRSTTAPSDGCDGQLEVQYNLLSGELLIGTGRIRRLPKEFTSHATYRRLFGDDVLMVNTLGGRGAAFQTQLKISGYSVYFTKRNSAEIVIRAQKVDEGSDRTYELIPHKTFEGDMPRLFIENYHHWMDIKNKTIEFRPLNEPWTVSTANWRLVLPSSDNTIPRLYRGGEELLDIKNPTTIRLASVFSPLDGIEFMHITVERDSKAIRINLPRLKLSFFINKYGDVESQQFPGMVIDPEQSIGTMVGLVNMLVLRQRDKAPGHIKRSIIIPHGTVTWGKTKDHCLIRISNKDSMRVLYHVYEVDVELGRLVGCGKLSSRLYQIYLHMLTAHCLVDKLTGMTGTEEALRLLRSAATWSFQMLTPEEAVLLKLIESFTPTRILYPPNARTMQQIEWNDLSPISQHEEFRELASSILRHAERMDNLTGRDGEKHENISDSYHLVERAALRHSVFRTQEFGGGRFTTSKDRDYEARDSVDLGPREARVFATARMIERWPSGFEIEFDLIRKFREWDEISGPQTNLTLGYNRRWLEAPPADIWWSLYEACLGYSNRQNPYQLMFCLCTLAHSGKMDQLLINTLLAVVVLGETGGLGHGPCEPVYRLSDGHQPNVRTLEEAIRTCAIPYNKIPKSQRTEDAREAEALFTGRSRRERHSQRLEAQIKSLAREFISCWPYERSFYPQNETAYWLLDIKAAVTEINGYSERCLRNKSFLECAELIQGTLRQFHIRGHTLPTTYSFERNTNHHTATFAPFGLQNTLAQSVPQLPDSPKAFAGASSDTVVRSAAATRDLNNLTHEFLEENPSGFEERYISDTRESLAAFNNRPTSARGSISMTSLECLPYVLHWKCWRAYVDKVFKTLCDSLCPKTGQEASILNVACCWPRVTPMSLLGLLSWDKITEISAEWKSILVQYGIAITMLQRARRMMNKARAGADSLASLEQEYVNEGHGDWDPMDHPDWLLIEIEGDFLIRATQAKVAFEMLSPRSGGNTLLQLNMGEGKSSVIIPIVAAALADGNMLARVLTLKPLSAQMFEFLTQKLGGLAGRRVAYLPFSRAIKLDGDRASEIGKYLEYCLTSRTIILSLPEHALSFKLSGPERLLDFEGFHVGQKLIELQRWLNANSRDILDESDELLNVRHELIYTIGAQSPVEHHPHRWVIVQQVLEVACRWVLATKQSHPGSVEVEVFTNGAFPMIRLLDESFSQKFIKYMGSDICGGRISSLPLGLLSSHMRRLAYKFITRTHTPAAVSCLPLELCDSGMARGIPKASLLLLRGLLVEKILLFALTKRWRVDYGLDLKRTLLAVPYRAKDIPSTRSDFSQPDIAIVLTCLSYYYGGLNISQAEHCFSLLQKMDDAEAEYDSWVHGRGDIPETFRRLGSLNLEDSEYRKGVILPKFLRNKPTIDFFLSRVVFPRHAMEFTYKLVASGWDLVETKSHPITGFSGTNDNRYLLPLSIAQHDIPQLKDTNARVLSYLLQPENNHYVCATGLSGGRLGTDELLKLIVSQDQPVQVLLDVGAQILDHENIDVAREWLRLTPEDKASAAVYLDEDDKIMVLSRDQIIQPLLASPFLTHMDQCLVYLDDAHTRGIDLKLPPSSRAAVTLGPMLTKDRLVQACMRMRNLGRGQSVMFLAPLECHRKILEYAKKPSESQVHARDILRWTWHATCQQTRKNVPLWATQGIDYLERCDSWQRSQKHGADQFTAIQSLRRPEKRTLEERYGAANGDQQPPSPESVSYATQESYENHCKIQEICDEFSVSSYSTVRMMAEEEKERETFHEMELEKEVLRSPKVMPSGHRISIGIEDLINGTPLEPMSAREIIPVFGYSANRNGGDRVWTGARLFVSFDHIQTVVGGSRAKIDAYLRPVNWVLSTNSPGRKALVVISPYEANALLPRIRKSTAVTLHTYAPKVTKSMQTLEDLSFCAVARASQSSSPSHLEIDQLNAFSGQLYLRDLEACWRLHASLGPSADVISSGTELQKSDRTNLDFLGGRRPLYVLSVEVLSELIACRRKGQGYDATHVGQILSGKRLSSSDFGSSTRWILDE